MTATARLRRSLPSFDGATGWLNSEPLGPADLLGRSVVVNFWTLTCINWLRTEPYVRAWSRAYRDDGLVVIGVHTPEFSFEHDAQAVRRAVQTRGIDYLVALDNDYAIWRAFDNHYWPALYFADSEGMIREDYFGEGHYEESERTIQGLLGVSRPLVRVEAAGVEAEADWEHLRSPEMYLGYGRATTFASRHDGTFGEPRSYAVPSGLNLNHWALDGLWTVTGEKVVANDAGATIAIRFAARDAHLVMAPGGQGPVEFRVLLDGEPPGTSAGTDIDENGNGVLEDGRLYQLVRVDDWVRERLLSITFLQPGAEAYAFTFG